MVAKEESVSDAESGWSGVSDNSSTDSECTDVEASSVASDQDRFDTAYDAFRDLADDLYDIDLRRYSRGVTSEDAAGVPLMDGQEKLQELVHLPRTWPLARLTIPLEGLSKQIDRLLEGYCFQILATNRDPEAHNGRVLQTATHLTWILAEYLADTIAWLMRSILGHASKILFDNDTQLLLTPKFWILPLYREFLNSARRIRPSPSSERARGCTGLVKVICKENKEQKGKRKYHAGTPHPNDRGGFTQWFGSCSLMSTLYVWFPASWWLRGYFAGRPHHGGSPIHSMVGPPQGLPRPHPECILGTNTRKEFSLLSRSEALGYREQCIRFRVKKSDHLPDIVREVQTEIESFHSMLEASVIAAQLQDVRISEGDQYLLYMRNLPGKVQEFLQLHQNATTVQQLFLGVQDFYIRTRVQGDMGSIHVTQPVGKPDVKDKTCFNCGKKGHLAENCPEPKKCSHCGKKGHLAKDCWEKHPDKKPTAKPKAKAQPTKPGGRGKGRGKGGRNTKGRGRGNKFRGVDGEEEQDDQEYDDEYEEEDQGEDRPEPEADPSAGGSVKQIHEQITMCVKECESGTSRNEQPVVESESHRVDEINLSEKFQSIGVGDPRRRWLVDSGATCHIIAERWLSNYKIVYRYEVGIPVLKGAGGNVLPTRGMVDLECKVGQTKVVMRKVVICSLDINVLSSYSLHEQGWETRLGTLKVSGLYHKKVKFPLKISDRAWWLEVQVLKSHGNKSRRKNDKGPQDMEIDCIKNVTTDLLAKACQTKDVLTEVDRPLSSAKTLESCVSDSPAVTKVSSSPHVSCEENVGRFQNMRKECRIKTFDGLGPFSYVCRMIRNEPNTNTTETGKSETVASSVDLCEPQLGHAGSSLTEEFIEGRHFVCAIDEVNHEHVRGFPVEIDLEGPPNDDDEDSGYVPTPEHEKDEAMPSELGERKEVIPQEPESDFSEDFEEPQLLGSLLRQHEARGHWPYDKGCDSCVQARGRTPARRRRHEGGDDQSPALTSMAADFTFVAGKYWRILVILMIHTGMMGMVVITGNRENDIKSIASVLNEIGVGGLNIEVATDNEGYLKDLMAKGLTRSNMRSFHWRNISEYRPQAKGIERAVGIAKEGIYTNWLAFEEH